MLSGTTRCTASSVLRTIQRGRYARKYDYTMILLAKGMHTYGIQRTVHRGGTANVPTNRESVTDEPTISIDRSGLMGMAHQQTVHEKNPDRSHKSPVTPLVSELHKQISIRGPLSVSDFMFQCLQNQQFGYYTSNKAESIIGGKGDTAANPTPADKTNMDANGTVSTKGGDFITSPELGQIFGEMLGIWVISVWEQLGSPAKWQLLELGPGKGTLMQDVLRAVARFPNAAKGLTIHLCETSTTMREEQVRRLNVQNLVRQTIETKEKKVAREAIIEAAKKAGLKVNPSDSPAPATSSSTPSTTEPSVNEITQNEALIQSLLDISNEKQTPDQLMYGTVDLSTLGKDASAPAATSSSSSYPSSHTVPIHWHTKPTQIPSRSDSGPLIILAHEFLDALPVYQFQLTERGWCEKLVDIDSSSSGPHHFRFVLSAQPTLASKTFLPEAKFPLSQGKIGDTIEIGAAGLACLEDLCLSLSCSSAGGAALLFDYGTNHPNGDTLQGMRSHSFVSPLSMPGQVDLTTLVDFKSLRATVERTNMKIPKESALSVLPLVTQSHLLRNLNISGRLERIVKESLESGSLSESQVSTLISNAIRLVNPDRTQGGMGTHFKAMCVISNNLKEKEIVPFNIPDELMAKEDQEYHEGIQSAAQSVGSNVPQQQPKEHLYSSSPASAPTPSGTPSPATPASTTPSNTLAARIEARRAAARQAAEQLAQQRREAEKKS